MPNTKGTQNTPIRFTEDDKAKVAAIRERFGLPSNAAAVRMAVTHFALFAARLDPGIGIPKKSRKRA